MEVINVQNLTKNFGSSHVLKGINLAVNKGEIFGFVGRNGAGKSTLINALTGIINKSSGSFSILGVPDHELDKVKHRVGVMPDVSNLYQHMKGLHFLKYMGRLMGDRRTILELGELMEGLGLKGAENKKIKSYSFGMKKKICIAQALLGEPELIILDEPTSGLDPESAIVVQKLISHLQKTGKTIFLTSHNLDEIDKISNRIAIMRGGVIKAIGTPRELKQTTKDSIRLSVRTKPSIGPSHLEEIKKTYGVNVNYIQSKNEYTYLNLSSEEDLPKFSSALIESGIHLYEIRVEEQSLEDVFITI